MHQLIGPSPKPTAVACTLGSNDLATQAERWRALYAAAGVERIETEHGLRVRFRRSTDVEARLGSLVSVETECCAWATWTVEADDDELVLVVNSTGEGVAVIRGWFLDDEPALPRSGFASRP